MCLAIVLAVRRHLHHIGPLTLWSGDGDATAFVLSAPPPAGWSLADERELDLLRGLPLPLRRRLALCTHVAWARRGLGQSSSPTTPAVDASRQAILGRAIRDTVLDALQAAEPGLRAGPDARVRWNAIGVGTRPAAQGRSRRSSGTSVHVQVSPTWLTEVWAPGHASTGDGGFVLARVPTGDGIRARVARWCRDDADTWVLRTTVESTGGTSRLR